MTAKILSDKDLIAFLSKTIDLAAEEVFWMLPDSTLFFVNSRTCERLGYSEQELIGMKVWDWDADITPESWPTIYNALKRDGKLKITRIHKSKNGREHAARINAYMFEYGGNDYIICIVDALS